MSRTCRSTIRLLLTAALTIVWSSAQSREAKPLSVCEVLAQLLSLNGKEVPVRGAWLRGHGSWLAPPDETCPQQLVTEGFVWDNTIHLVKAKRPLAEGDSAEELDLNNKLDVAFGEGGYFVVVTVVGTLETRVPPVVVHNSDGSAIGGGFGHLNIAPAELTYKRVAEAVLVKEKPDDKPDAPKNP